MAKDFKRLNEVERRFGLWRGRGGLDPVLSWGCLFLLVLCALLFVRLQNVSQRIEKAKDLLGDDPNRIATPARLYNILSGTDQLVPNAAHLTKDKPE